MQDTPTTVRMKSIKISEISFEFGRKVFGKSFHYYFQSLSGSLTFRGHQTAGREPRHLGLGGLCAIGGARPLAPRLQRCRIIYRACVSQIRSLRLQSLL